MSFSEKFCLKWNEFGATVSESFKDLRSNNDFLDVTLVCDDDQQVQAHKLILSACSPFFLNILQKNPHPHPLLYLKGVKSPQLLSMIEFIYNGEVTVDQQELNQFLEVAQDLKMKGLTSSQDFHNTRELNTNYNELYVPERKNFL